MNKQTKEYLESYEKYTKNTKKTHINRSNIFKNAQDGDIEALNYLFENNQYMIHEIINENTRFINTDLDIQIYIDFLTDTLIDCIKRFDSNKHVAFRAFARRMLYLRLSEFSRIYPTLTRTTIIPLSAYEKSLDEESYPICRDKKNVLLDEIVVADFNEDAAKNNAALLLEKLKTYISDEEYNILYSNIILKKSQECIAQENNSSRQITAYIEKKTKKRIRKLISNATNIYKLVELQNLPLQKAAELLNIDNLNHAAFYLQTYKYLYLGDEKPWGITTNGYLTPVNSKLYRYNEYYDVYQDKNMQLD